MDLTIDDLAARDKCVVQRNSNRLAVIERCFTVIKVLHSRPVTAAQLSRHMEVSERTAYRYIEAASLVFTMEETGDRPNKFFIRSNKRGMPWTLKIN